jgi:hypothetical protein
MSIVAAFPTAVLGVVARAEDVMTMEITAAVARLKDRHITRRTPGFDAAAQHVSTQGAHAFVPPNFAAGDQRGPCPGMFLPIARRRYRILTPYF